MAVKREMKEIKLETLDQVQRKVSLGKFKKGIVALVIVVAVAVGAVGVHRILSGDVLASRFIVNRMNCPACVVTVKEVTGKIPGVLETDVSLAAQGATVTFRDKQTNPEAIKEAIAAAGYPVRIDGTYKPPARGVDDVVIASVNGRLLFRKDMELPVDPTPGNAKAADPASAFFSVVGREVLLQAADEKQVVVQPYEVAEELEAYTRKSGMPLEELKTWADKAYGSGEKYFQVVAQRIGIRKLLEEHVQQGAKEPAEKERQTAEWIGKVFRDADVKVLEAQIREKLHASTGQDDWKVFWPLMIGKDTQLKRLLAN